MRKGAEEDVLREATEHLRAVLGALGVDLGPGEIRFVSPARAALLDFLDANPFATIHEIEIHNGDPKAWEMQEEVVTRKFRAGKER